MKIIQYKKNILCFIASCIFLLSYNSQAQIDKTIPNLEKAFQTKNEREFLNQFPSYFKEFNSYFGWDEAEEKASPLYDKSYNYINYWFSILAMNENLKYQDQIISIEDNGQWEADAINYFQDGALKFIKKNNRYALINDLENQKAKSVLYFLFDGPHPTKDEAFISNLNSDKKEIINDLFDAGFYKINAEELKNQVNTNLKRLSLFENNPNYFILEIDVNNDGENDKVVSSNKYKSNQLLFFLKKKNEYQLVLETINFSQDGGNIIDTIYKPKGKATLAIKTYFPDRGYLTATHYIYYKNNDWALQNTIYKTKTSTEKETIAYTCDVKQNLLLRNLNNEAYAGQIKYLPNEDEYDSKCKKVTKKN